MNDINSVIVEGTVIKPSVAEEPLTGTLTVTLNSERVLRRTNGVTAREVCPVPVMMRGSIAEYFKGSYKRFKKARVVGSLRQASLGSGAPRGARRAHRENRGGEQ